METEISPKLWQADFPVLLFQLDTDLKIQEVNNYVLECFGIPRAFLLGELFDHFLTRPSRILFHNQILPTLKSAGLIQEVFLHLGIPGREDFPVLIAAKCEKESPISPIWMACLKMTQRASWENQILEARKNAEASRAEAEAKSLMLEQAIKETEKVFAEKERFLAIAAHDIKNPISHIIAAADFLSNEYGNSMPASAVSLIEDIKHSGTYLLGLLQNLLEYNRIHSGKLCLENAVIDVEKILLEALSQQKIAATFKNIHFEMNVLNRDLSVVGDKDRILQVFMNLLGNAIKFSPENSKINIEAKGLDDHVEIAIHDQGPGIPNSELAELFQPFRKGSLPNVESGGGHGLGLWISKKLIEAHGGQISYTHGEPSGACFVIKLPRQPENCAPSDS